MPRAKATKTDAAGRKVPINRRGFGKVEQLPSGNYRVSYVGPDGNRYKAPTTFVTKGDANAWLAARRSEIQRETWKPPVVVESEQFGKYGMVWVAHRRGRDGKPLAPSTRADYEAAITRRGLSQLAKYRMSDLTPAILREWHAKRVKNSGASLAGKEARVLRAILNTALSDGLIESNPCPPDLAASKTGIKRREVSPDELAALIEAIAPRFKLALALAAFGGLRLGEWRALRRSDLTLQPSGHYVVSVSRQAQRVKGVWITTPPKSDDGIREVALPQFLNDSINSHLDQFVGKFPADLIFASGGEGDFVDQAWRRAWDAAREAAGLSGDVTLVGHSLRHFYGSTLAASGMGIRQLQAALGHGSPAATLGYLHANKGADTSVADIFKPLPAAQPSNVIPMKKSG